MFSSLFMSSHEHARVANQNRIDYLIEELKAGRVVDCRSRAELLKRALECHVCKEPAKDIAALKAHLTKHFVDEK